MMVQNSEGKKLSYSYNIQFVVVIHFYFHLMSIILSKSKKSKIHKNHILIFLRNNIKNNLKLFKILKILIYFNFSKQKVSIILIIII
jgi:hypothetical protein